MGEASVLLPLKTRGVSESNGLAATAHRAEPAGEPSLPAPAADSNRSPSFREPEGSATSEATVLFGGSSSTADTDGAGAPPGSDSPAAESGPRFQIQKELGRGAMGIGYLAFDTLLHRLVALKCPMLADDADPSCGSVS